VTCGQKLSPSTLQLPVHRLLVELLNGQRVRCVMSKQSG
jgi:hypothetical protein